MTETPETPPQFSGGDSITFDGSTPRNTQFGDTYFSKADGRAEASHVFLGCNGLPDRWAEMNSGQEFVIGELGFGTGLNFLETARQWKASNAKGKLIFVSFEAYPMGVEDLVRSLEPWPELGDGAAFIAQHWPPAQGKNLMEWQDVELRLIFGDAREELERRPETFDAWYLDGFAPSRNPELWEADLLQSAHDKTAPGGTFATYTSAGWVRRNLLAAGFDVEKVPGHANKREMMRGLRPNT
ncbi:MAG: tRNA (5-methylaminomethyl-2-thiouridine)(34)-methyltransferase MnmD [Pseudomonadota bacterium]